MRLEDASTRYGWTSIALHWAGAIAAVMLWLIGHVMTAQDTAEARKAELVHVHTSVAVAVYGLLAGRIVHRLAVGFPGPAGDLSPVRFVVTRTVQYAVLIGIAVQLISGPLMVWANGDAIGVFDWGAIPSPFEPSAALHALLLEVHRTTRWALMVAVLAHVGGVLVSPAEVLNRMLAAPPAAGADDAR